jgi:hypothetical protein
MSLVGRLEDLSLGEILQIVSLSKRSGLLRLESPEGKANIFIQAGNVIYAARSDEKEGVLSLLVHHGLVKLDQLEAIRAELESSVSAEELCSLLDEKLGISPEAFQQVLKRRVEELVYSLFYWEEGTFSFQLIEEEKDHPFLMRMRPFFLVDGIGAQFLVMEGARRKDELGRAVSTEPPAPDEHAPEPDMEMMADWEQELPEHFATKAVVSEEDRRLKQEIDELEVPLSFPHLHERVAGTVLLIGLDRTLVAGITDALKGRGITLLVHDNGADGLTKIQELRQLRINPFLIVDVEATGITDNRVMGGLEVLSTMWDLGLSLPVGLLHRKELPAELIKKIGSVPGIYFFPVSDPSREEEVVGEILDAIEHALSVPSDSKAATREEPATPKTEVPVERAADVGSPAPESPAAAQTAQPEAESAEIEDYYDIRQELSGDLEGMDLPFDEGWEEEQGLPQEMPLDPHMAQLSSYVSELNRQDISGEITLLALRFAAFFVSRAVLFLVRKGDITGLGQFGVDLGKGRNAESAIRSLSLQTEHQSVFTRVVRSQQSYK